MMNNGFIVNTSQVSPDQQVGVSCFSPVLTSYYNCMNNHKSIFKKCDRDHFL